MMSHWLCPQCGKQIHEWDQESKITWQVVCPCGSIMGFVQVQVQVQVQKPEAKRKPTLYRYLEVGECTVATDEWAPRGIWETFGHHSGGPIEVQNYLFRRKVTAKEKVAMLAKKLAVEGNDELAEQLLEAIGDEDGQ